MKFSTTEEYGLRCLIRIGKFYNAGKSLTIPEISRAEGISEHNAGKILRVLRIGGLLIAERGNTGGYTLSKSPEEIKISEVLFVLGGKLYDDEFCKTHTGASDLCTNSIDCSVRSLWKIIQDTIDGVVQNLTLRDLLGTEDKFMELFSNTAHIPVNN
jgi:Rrf2 family transcriptional regulator, iron-sulfur cluster assembly transcription factor